MENIDWSLTLTIAFGIIGTVLAVVGIINYTKKNSIKVTQKNSNGNANMNNNTIANEIYTDRKRKEK